jgi:hypothetical protein
MATPRSRIPTSQKAKALKERRRFKRTPHFKAARPEGKLIYENPDARPIGLSKTARIEKQHIEWVRDDWVEPLSRGGTGTIYLGKMKIKGKNRAQRVLLKRYKDFILKMHVIGVENIKNVLERLEKSGVPHPKMGVLETSSGTYMIMEPFVTGKRGSKMLDNYIDLVKSLNLSQPKEKKILKDIARITARLSKNGLYYRQSLSPRGVLRADIFTLVSLKGGKTRVMVQDIDTLFVSDNPIQNWHASCQVLLDTVSQNNPKNLPIARTIINQTAVLEQLPELK